MGAPIFISYSRADIAETNWLERLRMYLAPFSRQGAIDAWDDGRISTGTNWRQEIEGALNRSVAAILLVGPGFLASEFVMDAELPALLKAAKGRGLALFPIIVGYCGYEASALGGIQAHNQPDEPLESLARPEQNRVLNDFAVAIGKAFPATAVHSDSSSTVDDLVQLVVDIQSDLADTKTAFQAQAKRRDLLVKMIERRLSFRNDLQYEKFFFKYHSQLTPEERFEFDQIRAITEGPLQEGNRRMLERIEGNRELLEAVPKLTALRQHLVFWLNKFDRVFVNNRAMCLLYTGVEDGVPFPPGLDRSIADWLAARD